MKITFSKIKNATQIVFKEKAHTSFEKGKLILPKPKKEDIDEREIHRMMRKIVRVGKKHGLETLSVDVSEFSKYVSWSKREIVQHVVTNLLLAEYEFRAYRTRPKEGWGDVREISIITGDSKTYSKEFRSGKIIAEEMNKARTLSNTPGGDMTPVKLAAAARKAASGLPVRVTVFDEKKMKQLKMGALLGVGQGSKEPSRFIIMEYWGKGKGKERPTMLVGKGVTFDTGGLSLKPSQYMTEMMMDMSGGAAAIHTLTTLARLKANKNIVALIPTVENSLSGESYRPGDIVTSMSGKTIEVLNTDAEGRLILADALTYAKKYKPKMVIDIATLTGAAVVALGERASGLFTQHDGLADQLFQIGQRVGDPVWRLPLWREYESDMKGTFGELTNIHNKDSKYGGALTAAAFLAHFTKDYAKDCLWAHIDIAPRMTSIEEDQYSKGAIAAPVRLLAEYLK